MTSSAARLAAGWLQLGLDFARAGYLGLHAYLRMKRPGESDGTGDGWFSGPPHGQWFADYAVALVNDRPNQQT